MPITLVVCLVRIMQQNQTYSLCKSFVLQWDIIDLDNALILLEELLFLGKAVFFNPFNVKAQSPCNTCIMKRRYELIEVNTSMVMCQCLTSLCSFMSQHYHLLQYGTEFDDNGDAENIVCVFYICVPPYRPLREEQQGTTWIPRGPQSPGNFTVLVRVLTITKTTLVPYSAADAKIEDHINEQSQTPNLCESTSNICLLLPATKTLIKLNV